MTSWKWIQIYLEYLNCLIFPFLLLNELRRQSDHLRGMKKDKFYKIKITFLNFLLAYRGRNWPGIFLVGAEEPRIPCKCFAGGTFPSTIHTAEFVEPDSVFLVLITFHLYSNYYPPPKKLKQRSKLLGTFIWTELSRLPYLNSHHEIKTQFFQGVDAVQWYDEL